MSKRPISGIAIINLITMFSLLSSGIQLMSRVHSILLLIKYGGTFEIIDFSFYSITVNINTDTFTIENAPLIIALAGIVINIAALVINHIKNKKVHKDDSKE